MEGISRKLDSAIRMLDEKLQRSHGEEDRAAAVESTREQINKMLDNVSPGRKSSMTLLGKVARKHTTNNDSTESHLRALKEEIRWVDEESSLARRELEDRLETRIVDLESKLLKLTELSVVTEERLKNFERRLDSQENICKRTRASLEEFAGKVSGAPNKSELLLKELLTRVQHLERDIDGERERSIRAVELVANALTPTRQLSNGTRNLGMKRRSSAFRNFQNDE